tara:strand:- start:189 stop:1097 length:909 start_codon:yes stop_codon:yes gene_type:complete
MAIFAKIHHKSISASAVHRKMDSSTSIVNWQRLFLHDVHVNPEATIYPLVDLFEVLESTAISFGKLSIDQFGLHTSDPVFAVNKARSDSTSLVESLSTHPNKGASDTLSLSDDQVLAVGKTAEDSFGFTEDVHKLLTYIRSFDDSNLMVDSAAIDIIKPRDDSFGFSDAAATHPNKALSHSTSLSDSPLFDVSTAYQSSTTFSEQTVMTRQPFNFVFTEASGVVTVTGEPTDSSPITESITSFSVSAALQDYFALDDFAQIEKDVEGVKSNVIGMTDSIEFEHQITGALLNKSLVGRMVLNA